MSVNANKSKNQATSGSKVAYGATSAANKKAADAGADLTRTHVETAQEIVLSGSKMAINASGRSLKHFEEVLSEANAEEAIDRSSLHVDAISSAGTAMAKGFQDISREWMNWTKSSAERSNGAIRALVECRSPQDFFQIQNRLVKENLEGLMTMIHKVSEISTYVSQTAAQKTTTGPYAGTN